MERLKHSKPEIGEDSSKERYRYLQWLADYNAIKEVPSVQPERLLKERDAALDTAYTALKIMQEGKDG